MSVSKVVIKPGREDSLLRRHPWIFSGAVADVGGQPGVGDTVEVVSADGSWLARAAWSPRSKICARVWTFEAEDEVGPEWFRARIEQAVAYRAPLVRDTDACRLVHGEADGLPGVVVDRYGAWLAGQFLSAGADRWKADLVRLLLECTGCRGFYERSDENVREKEGLVPTAGPRGGDDVPPSVPVLEDGLAFEVDIRGGHKTGFYLDQRQNRRLLEDWVRDADVLDAFCYTGGFAMHALKAGAARVSAIDVSDPALDICRRQVRANGLDESRLDAVKADVFSALRGYRDARRRFDVIVLDPPKFAATRAQVPGAVRGYKDINLLALKLLNPGGVLMTFSCSGSVSAELFRKVVAGAAADAGCDVRVVGALEQAPDHPASLAFPEASYLKGLLCRVSRGSSTAAA
jgi:23S rRNA (cytosine1962-C5)-methyltransferase